jgi:hypothetical protein
MASPKKKTFDAVAESRRWRISTGRKLRAMTPKERREHLRQVTEAFAARKPASKKTAVPHR